MPEISNETAVEEEKAVTGEVEKGEVTWGDRVAEDVVVIDESEVCADPAGTKQVAPTDQPL